MVSETILPKTDAAGRDRTLLAPSVAAALLTAFIALLGWWLAHGTITSHFVRVHWQPHASAAQRSEHTRDLSLHVTEEGTSNGLRTGVYLLADTSRENIARILGDSLIVRTDFIDPATLRATQPYARPRYMTLSIRYPWLPAATVLRPWAIVPVAALCFLLMVAASRRGRQWLAERVPPISPATLGLFRVGFAMALWVTVDRRIDGAELRTVLFTLLVAFALGVAARLTFVAFVFLATREFYGGAEGHDLALPLKTLWLLTLVPWGAGLSVDETLRRYLFRRYNTNASRLYGLALWIPVAMLGVSYAAAAYAKLDEVGIRWITGGAVRYIFIADATRAPMDWGRAIARSDLLPVIFSAGAIATEWCVLLPAVWWRPGTLLVGGMGALGLQGGFYLFQGVWWHWWWVLLTAFLPWEGVTRLVRRTLPQVVILTNSAGDAGRRLALVKALDWFDRVSIQRLHVSGTPHSKPVLSVLVDDQVITGGTAWLRVLTALPIAWPVLPIAAPALLWRARPAGPRLLAATQPVGEAVYTRPWRRLHLPGVIGCIVFVAVLQQPVVSVLRAEYWFLLSDFPMYSNIYGINATKAEFAGYAERNYQPPAIVQLRPRDTRNGQGLQPRVDEIDPDRVLVRAASELAGANGVSETTAQEIAGLAARYASRFGPDAARVDALADTWRFDWSKADFVPRGAWKHVGVIDLAAGTITPSDAR